MTGVCSKNFLRKWKQFILKWILTIFFFSCSFPLSFCGLYFYNIYCQGMLLILLLLLLRRYNPKLESNLFQFLLSLISVNCLFPPIPYSQCARISAILCSYVLLLPSWYFLYLVALQFPHRVPMLLITFPSISTFVV